MTTVDVAPGVARPRGPGVAYTALGVALLVLLAVVAYSVPQQPPPAIAEFSPQPQQLIKTPPPDQTAIGESEHDDGRGGNQGSGGGGGTPTSQLPKVDEQAATLVPRQRDCIGELQIQDPQSPPCVPGFIGDNGGATSFGVSADSINVSISLQTYQYADPRAVEDLRTFFNKRFELYGRQLKFKFLDDTADGENSATVDQMIADAITVHDSLQAFASIGYTLTQQATSHYYFDKLAELGIVSVMHSIREPVTFIDQAHIAKHAPYEWNYIPTIEQMQAMEVDLICNALAKRPAIYAGSPDLQAKERKLGIIVGYKSNTSPPENAILKEGVKRCTGSDLVQLEYTDGNAGAFPQFISALRQANVTTVMCMCYWANLALLLMPQASNQAYYPEWFLDGFGANDQDYGCHTDCPPDQSKSIFALRSTNKAQAMAETPYLWAIKDVDPEYPSPGCNGCSAKVAPDSKFNSDVNAVYQNMLMLASGIQMAGPRLTPETFQQGLFRTRFPNPGCDGPPWYQACVGFSATNRSMLKSFALEWYSNSEIAAEYKTPGTYCYVDQGRRMSLGKLPRTDSVFFDLTKPCR